MCKKLMFLISFVFVLGMVTSVYADDYDYTNDYPWSMLYVSPWNWDPVSPYGGPGDGDQANIEEGGVCVMDTDITVQEIRGPHNADDPLTVYVIKDANVIVYEWQARDGSDHPLVPALILADDAKVYAEKQMRFWDQGSGLIDISDNAELICEDMRTGDEGDENAFVTINVSGNGRLESYYGGVSIGDETPGEMNFSGNAVVEINGRLAMRNRESGRPDSVFNISDNAIVNIGDDWRIGWGESSVIANVSGNAAITAGGMVFARDNDAKEPAVMELYMTGGSIVVDGGIGLPDHYEATSSVKIELTGGVIEAEEMYHETDFWTVVICGDGVMILDGDVVDEVLAQAADGHWLACPEEDCFGNITPHGTLMVDYDNVNSGKTTIWSEVVPTAAWAPQPADGATEVPSIGTILCWCLGEGAEVSHLYLGTDEALVAAYDASTYQGAIHGDNCFDPGVLQLCTTYYWAIVEQDAGINLTYGPAWSFTVECCRTVEGFEDYDITPDYYIWDTWIDGCGTVDGHNGNATGSCISLSMDILHEGAKAMSYAYNNDAYDVIYNRDANYSEATRTFDPPLDLTLTGEVALVAYFYGDGDNDLTDMWTILNGSIADIAVYGDNGEDVANIQSEEWTDWNMELTGFAGVDLSSVATVSIGFGDVVGDIPDLAMGIVRFDDISVCPVRCVPKFIDHIIDLNDDCVSDWLDVGIMGDNWLADRR